MSKFTLRWGILATGGIAASFSRDLSVNPETRERNDIEHVVVAAASSSSADRAKKFLKEVYAPESAKAYGSYKELVADPNVDIIYVATPHSHHYQNTMLCLEAGKNVLCEKSFTTNAAQVELLIKKAREKNLFLMEAVWTRYFPLSIYAREMVTSGKLGTVERTFADNSHASPPETTFPDDHRMVNPDLAGGALLDLGIYSLTWVFQTLYTTQKNPKPPTVLSTMRKYPKTGVDEQTSMLLTFPRDGEGDAHGIATTGMRVATDPNNNMETPAIRIQGTKGELLVFPPAYRPTRTKLVLNDGTVEVKDWPHPGPGKGSGFYNGFIKMGPEGETQGMFWEADECAYALKEGRKEGRFESLDESLLIMKVMDEVRKQNDFKLPEKIETTEYPVDM